MKLVSWNVNGYRAVMKKDFMDLFNAVFIKLPPLRERKEDIPLLINHFLYNDGPTAKTRIYGITPSAMNILLKYQTDIAKAAKELSVDE